MSRGIKRRTRMGSHVTTAEIRRAIRAENGNVQAAARRLGLQDTLLHYELRARSGLRDYLTQIRVRRRDQRRQQLMRLLQKHHGNLMRGAREAGVSQSTFASAVHKLGMAEVAQSLRPRLPSPAEEKARIFNAIRHQQGQLWRCCKELGISKNTLRSKMLKYDLVGEADALRADANLIGRRTQLPFGRQNERRVKLMALIDSCGWNLSRATKRLGVSPATFYKNMRELDVKRPPQLSREHRFHRLVDALRLFKGRLGRVAVSMAVPISTVLVWCEEFEIDPVEYKK